MSYYNFGYKNPDLRVSQQSGIAELSSVETISMVSNRKHVKISDDVTVISNISAPLSEDMEFSTDSNKSNYSNLQIEKSNKYSTYAIIGLTSVICISSIILVTEYLALAAYSSSVVHLLISCGFFVTVLTTSLVNLILILKVYKNYKLLNR